eukprot:gene48100-58918_t
MLKLSRSTDIGEQIALRNSRLLKSFGNIQRIDPQFPIMTFSLINCILQRKKLALCIAKERQQQHHSAAARFGAEFEGQLRTGLTQLGELTATRTAISAFTLPAAASTAYYTTTISRLLDVVVAMSHLSKDADIGNGISCYVNFVQAKEQAGIERATLTGVFVADAVTDESFRRFSQVQAAQTTFLRVFESFASPDQRRFVTDTISGPAIDAVAAMRQVAFEKSSAGRFGVVANTWFEASTARINLMKAVEDRLAADYAQN